MFKFILIYLVLLCLLIVGCSKHSDISVKSKVDYSLYDEIIKNIDIDTYDEIDWMTEEPTGGIIVYYGYKLFDIDNDGIAELFIIRRYVNNQVRYVFDKNQINNIGDYNKFAIRQGFISESYKIIDGKVEPLIIDNEMVGTQAFQGGHFGFYYYLFNDGKIAKFYNSYWSETLILYNNMKQELVISYDGDMGTGEWSFSINGENTDIKNIKDILQKLVAR